MPALQERTYLEPQAPDEVRLEAVLHQPGSGTDAAVAVCHPHPQYGGDMDNYVVAAICGSLVDAGIAALRFNFRGTGGSAGVYGGGEAEVRDLQLALRWLSEDRKFVRLAACGYSFGALVANRARDVAAIACVSPANPVVATDVPTLIVIGDSDQFMPAEKLRAFAEQHEGVSLEVFRGDDHFWPVALDAAAGTVSSFLKRHLEGED